LKLPGTEVFPQTGGQLSHQAAHDLCELLRASGPEPITREPVVLLKEHMTFGLLAPDADLNIQPGLMVFVPEVLPDKLVHMTAHLNAER